jgi:hypothetical protein
VGARLSRVGLTLQAEALVAQATNAAELYWQLPIRSDRFETRVNLFHTISGLDPVTARWLREHYGPNLPNDMYRSVIQPC